MRSVTPQHGSGTALGCKQLWVVPSCLKEGYVAFAARMESKACFLLSTFCFLKPWAQEKARNNNRALKVGIKRGTSLLLCTICLCKASPAATS